MVLVPLGISVGTWARSIDPKSQSRRAKSDNFTDETGLHSFHRVMDSVKKEKSPKKQIIHPKLISPVQQILQQTKEKEKRGDGPDTENITFNMAASSTASSGKGRGGKRKKNVPTSHGRSDTKKKSQSGTTIKRLQRKRKSQSITKRQSSNKSGKKK